MTTNNAPMYTFGSYNSQFFASEYLNYPISQGMETIENLKTTNITNLNSSLSIIGSKDVVLRANGVGTVDVISAGIATFGSWNGAETRIGTNSYQNITIGANGTGSLARTTTINGETINIGSSTGTTSLNGNTVIISGDSSASFSSRTGTTTIGVSGSLVTVPGGIQLATGKNLQLGAGGNIQFGSGSASYIQSQLGWSASVLFGNKTLTATSQQILIFSNVQIGVYMLTISVSCNSYTVGSGKVNFGINKTNCNSSILMDSPGGAGTGAEIPVTYTGNFIPTSADNSFEILALATAGSITITNPRYTIIRIG